MKGSSLINIFALPAVICLSAMEWQQTIDSALRSEFYRREVDVSMRQDLITADEWQSHALALSKGEAHIYSYTISNVDGGQIVKQKLHPYTGFIGNLDKKGYEIPLTIYGTLPVEGTLGAHINVQFKDRYNKMKCNVVFFGKEITCIHWEAAMWCEEYFTKCEQAMDAIPNIRMEELFVQPHSRITTQLPPAPSKKLTGLTTLLKTHFKRRHDSIPQQDGNPCVIFYFERPCYGEIEKSEFQVRITHVVM